MAEKLFEPIHEHEGIGEMILASGERFDVNFVCRQLQNGRILGEIDVASMTFGKAHHLLMSLTDFTLSGEDKSGDRIVINRCYLNNVKSNGGISAKFSASEVIRKPEKLRTHPKNELVVVFGLLNVDETFRVSVDTHLGRLYLNHIKGYKEHLPVIMSQNVSAVTAVAKIHIKNPDTNLSFKDVLSESVDVVEGFLRITSLAQTCYHDRCSVGIYEKTKDSGGYELVLYKMIRSKLKMPKYRGLTNPAHSSRFVESAYRGYRGREKELKDLYDFEIALEWYLESNIASILESGYLASCTCLELLVDRYKTHSKTGYIIEPKLYKEEMYPVLEKVAREYMKEIETTPRQRNEIYIKLKWLNRRSFRAGIESLLDHLGVKHDDLFDDLGIIIKVRDKITHEGTYTDIDKLAWTRNRLYVLLTRILLSILNYENDYYDWVRGEWVHFNDVCKKV